MDDHDDRPDEENETPEDRANFWCAFAAVMCMGCASQYEFGWAWVILFATAYLGGVMYAALKRNKK